MQIKNKKGGRVTPLNYCGMIYYVVTAASAERSRGAVLEKRDADLKMSTQQQRSGGE